MADQISDAISTPTSTEDPHARIAVETPRQNRHGHHRWRSPRTHTYVSLEDIVRDVILAIGYNSSGRRLRWGLLRPF